MAKRLTELHPLTKKLRALETFMDETKIQLEWNGYRLVVTDTETGEEANYKDNESGEACNEMPWLTETKLVRED